MGLGEDAVELEIPPFDAWAASSTTITLVCFTLFEKVFGLIKDKRDQPFFFRVFVREQTSVAEPQQSTLPAVTLLACGGYMSIKPHCPE